VACGYDDDDRYGNLKVLSPSLELVQTLVRHDGYVECVTVSPSGSHFASGGTDGKVIIWSEPGEGGEWARVQVLEEHTDRIRAVCFSPDGKQLATGSWDYLINLYSFNEGSAILAHTLEGHTDWVKSLSFSHDCYFFLIPFFTLLYFTLHKESLHLLQCFSFRLWNKFPDEQKGNR